MHRPYSEEWWLCLDVRNALRKAIERSKKDAEILRTSDETGDKNDRS